MKRPCSFLMRTGQETGRKEGVRESSPSSSGPALWEVGLDLQLQLSHSVAVLHKPSWKWPRDRGSTPRAFSVFFSKTGPRHITKGIAVVIGKLGTSAQVQRWTWGLQEPGMRLHPVHQEHKRLPRVCCRCTRKY